MARCGWHWVSFDLLFATLGLGLVNFTEFFDNEKTLLQIISVYFLGYAIVWALTISISKAFPKNYLKLGQWMLLLLISGLIYLGTQ
jgi:drug/metabolite transporter (DMT)-like permease